MRKLLLLAVCLLTLYTVGSIPAQAAEMTQPRRVGDTYFIGTEEELHWFAALCNGEVTDPELTNSSYSRTGAVLTADITLTREWTPINSFSGVFDGGGHTVSGVYISNMNGKQYLGFFCSMNGMVKDLHLSGTVTVTDAYTGRQYIGGIAGSLGGDGQLSNCSFDGSITVNSSMSATVGGIVALGNRGTIRGCANDAAITVTTSSDGGADAAGIVGISYGGVGEISDCHNRGSINVSCTSETSYGSVRAGGIAATCDGYSSRGAYPLIQNCSNTGSIKAVCNSTYIYGAYRSVGGLVGKLGPYATMVNSFNTGAVSLKSPITTQDKEKYDGRNSVGGLVGALDSDTTLANSYNTGTVTGQLLSGSTSYNMDRGALVGTLDTGTLTCCYAYLNGLSYVGRSAPGSTAASSCGSMTSRTSFRLNYSVTVGSTSGSYVRTLLEAYRNQHTEDLPHLKSWKAVSNGKLTHYVSHYHPVCGDLYCTEHGASTLFSTMSGGNIADPMRMGGGDFVLEEDWNIGTGRILLDEGVTLTICMNGHDMIYYGTDAAITVPEGATLYLCDCQGGGTIIASQGVGISNSGTTYICGGDITAKRAISNYGTLDLYDTHLTGTVTGVYNGWGGMLTLQTKLFNNYYSSNDVTISAVGSGGVGIDNWFGTVEMKSYAPAIRADVAIVNAGTLTVNYGMIEGDSIAIRNHKNGEAGTVGMKGNLIIRGGDSEIEAKSGGTIQVTANSFSPHRSRNPLRVDTTGMSDNSLVVELASANQSRYFTSIETERHLRLQDTSLYINPVWELQAAACVGGSCTVTVDGEQVNTAFAGSTVVITPQANIGYQVSAVSAGSCEVTDNGDGTYSFTMPAEAVEIQVVFRGTPTADMFTMTPPVEAVYTGEAILPNVEWVGEGTAPAFSVIYRQNGTIVDAPVNAGSYTVAVFVTADEYSFETELTLGEYTISAAVSEMPAPPVIHFVKADNGTSYTAYVATIERGLYSFDGVNFSEVCEKTGVAPGEELTVWVKVGADENHLESSAASACATAPRMAQEFLQDSVVTVEPLPQAVIVVVAAYSEGRMVFVDYIEDGTEGVSSTLPEDLNYDTVKIFYLNTGNTPICSPGKPERNE